jgi:hypothetical protein
VTASYALFENGDRNATKAMIQDEANFVLSKITFALENSKTINAPSVGTPGSYLSVTTYEPSSVTVSLSGGNVIYNGDTTHPLNNSNISVSALTFTHTGSGSNPESVQVDLTISAKTPTGATITQSLSATRYVRK